MPDEETNEDDGTPSALAPTENIADPVRNRRRKVERGFQERERLEFWQSIMSTKIGRREMWDLLENGHAFQTQFAVTPAGFPDANAAWFHAGEQAYAYRLFLTMMKNDPANTQVMLQEFEARIMPDKKS